MHIDAYTHTAPALLHGYQPNRSRFILLHKKEIGKIAARLSQ
jgi:tmRNA-binding protein